MDGLGNKKILACNLQRLMAEKGVTAKELSKILHYPYTTLLSWLKADNYPRIDKIQAMADYFGVVKSELVDEKRPEENDTHKSDLIEDKTKKPVKDDELSESQQILIDYAKGLTEDQAAKVLQLMKSIVAFDE